MGKIDRELLIQAKSLEPVFETDSKKIFIDIWL